MLCCWITSTGVVYCMVGMATEAFECVTSLSRHICVTVFS